MDDGGAVVRSSSTVEYIVLLLLLHGIWIFTDTQNYILTKDTVRRQKHTVVFCFEMSDVTLWPIKDAATALLLRTWLGLWVDPNLMS
jgi:hypothetical protein